MIVLDASALIELILGTPAGKSLAARIAAPETGLHIPHLADIEIAQVLRRYVRNKVIDPIVAATALDDLCALDLQRHAHEPLLLRVWALRDNLSAYDAVYVALAEVLDATLLTGDARLAAAPGVACRIEMVG
ncbi:MAG TPA: type II toxin-antitoxin system VapC family toxin [Steroidobacteraceae bacterium]|nr:type II toxin-antitoxin system VapC family toxin [Steroidobacteraceae bacterium]